MTILSFLNTKTLIALFYTYGGRAAWKHLNLTKSLRRMWIHFYTLHESRHERTNERYFIDIERARRDGRSSVFNEIFWRRCCRRSERRMIFISSSLLHTRLTLKNTSKTERTLNSMNINATCPVNYI